MSVINPLTTDSAVSLHNLDPVRSVSYMPVASLLDQRDTVIETTRVGLLSLADLPLTTQVVGEQSLRQLTPLKNMTDEVLQRSVRAEQLWDDRISTPKPQKDSRLVQALIDPVNSDSPSARIAHSDIGQQIATVMPRFAAAEEYLHPRDLISQSSIKNKPNVMPKMTKSLMETILNGRSMIKKQVLGEGSQGKVSLLHVEGTPYVVKEWLPAGQTVKHLEQIANLALATNDSKPVVQAQAMTKNTMVMEYLPHGDLLSLFPEDEDAAWMSESTFIQVAKDMAHALNYVNQQEFYHADVKPDNFMRTPSGVKLADFGCAQKQEVKGVSGTFDYMAPELITGTGANSTEADVFSFGMIMYYYLTSDLPDADIEDTLHPLLQKTQDEKQLLKYCRTEPRNTSGLFVKVITEKLRDCEADFSEIDSTGALRELDLQCLSIDPAKRPTFQEIEERLVALETQ